jgi:hypothetical protein
VVPSNKIERTKLRRRLTLDNVGAPVARVRARGTKEPADAYAMLTAYTQQGGWAAGKWVASIGILDALLDANSLRFWKLVATRSTHGNSEPVVEAIVQELYIRCVMLTRVVYARSATPVWGEEAWRLVSRDLDEHNSWTARALRRVGAISPKRFWRESQLRGARQWDVLVMLAKLSDSLVDDVAKVCGVGRSAVLLLIWDGWVED